MGFLNSKIFLRNIALNFSPSGDLARIMRLRSLYLKNAIMHPMNTQEIDKKSRGENNNIKVKVSA